MSEVRVPAHLQPYVEALGVDAAIGFFLGFGGAQLYLSENPRSNSMVAEAIGPESVAKLAAHVGSGHVRVPVGKYWMVQHLYAEGETIMGIARRLHTTEMTIRRWLKKADIETSPRKARKTDIRQGDLFPS